MAEEPNNDAPAEGAPVDEATEAAPPEPQAAAPDTPAPAAPAEPVEVLAPKERRQRARAARAAATPTRAPRTPEERQGERQAERRQKAVARRAERQRSRAKYQAARADAPAEATPPRERGPGRQKTRQGIVVSDKADKTITVRIDIARRHRRYEKIVRTSNTLHAHDEQNDAHIGDTVVVRESRPLSRSKRWRLIRVVERAQ